MHTSGLQVSFVQCRLSPVQVVQLVCLVDSVILVFFVKFKTVVHFE